MADVSVNDTVVVDPHGFVGTVKYKGPTKFAAGKWVGVQLQTPDGKNDGTVKGVRYFDCPPDHGLFVRPGNVALVRNDKVKSLVRSKSGRRVVRPRPDTMSSPDGMVLGSLKPDLASAVVDFENPDLLRILVEEDGNAVTGVDKFGNTLLHILAKHGGGRKACQTMGYLLQHGLSPFMHVRNIYGATAAMVAAREKRWMEMEYLVSQGGDVICKGPSDSLPSPWESSYYHLDGRAALHRAIEAQKRARQEGRLVVPKMRHKYSTLIEALFRTAHAGDMKYVRMLLEERDMNVNSVDANGNNVLHWIASDHKRLPIIKYLVAMGSRMEAKNKDGETPAMIAARTRAWKVMRYLVSMGASVTEKDLKGQNVFSHSRVCEASRQALKEGLAEKHANQLTNISGEEGLAGAPAPAPAPEQHERRRSSGHHGGGGAAAPAHPAGDYEQELQDAQDEFNRETYDDYDEEQESEHDAYHTVEDVQNDLEKEGAGATDSMSGDAEAQQKTAGKFSGVLYGRKKDKSASKVCMVTVSEESILLSYKKGGFFNRTSRVEEYKWSDQMSLRKVASDELQVVLDPAHNVVLHVKPCHPDSVEEFIWIHIWKSVFEVSVREAKELLREYEGFCQDTVKALQSQAEKQEANEQAIRSATERGGAEVDSLTREGDRLEREMNDLLSRFTNIRQQGETLRDTFEKMYEALERRYNTEQARHTECVNKQQSTKANQLKADMTNIKEQMERVAADKARVAEMYEDMKQQELTYSHFGQEEYW